MSKRELKRALSVLVKLIVAAPIPPKRERIRIGRVLTELESAIDE